MNNVLISIVVPVYNVENYLVECVESLVNQTYTNIEIILVNDGSTDDSGTICSELAKKDSRIRVFNKENGGLSDARNFGIDKALGEYLTFVDSDDIISPFFIESMYKAIKIKNTKLAICKIKRFKKSIEINGKHNANIEFFSEFSEEVLKKILYQIDQDLYSIAACAKLYSKTIFDHLRFPIGKINEDMLIIVDVMKLCKEISIVEEYMYYYRLNLTSITMQSFSSRRMDAIYASKKIVNDIKDNYPFLKNAAETLLFSRSCEMLCIAKYSLQQTNQFVSEKKELINLIKKYRLKVLKDKNARTKARGAALLSFLNINLMIYILNQVRSRRYR